MWGYFMFLPIKFNINTLYSLCVKGVWVGGVGGVVSILGEYKEADHHSISDHHPHLPGNT